MKIFKKLVLYFVLILFYISIAEFILRLFDPEVVFVKSFDDDLLFSMYPNKSGYVVSDEYKVLVETNNFGGRQKLTSDNYPVLLVGDSFSEGWGVEENEVFTEIANKELPKDKKIRNMGVHGSSPSLMYIHLKEYVKKFRPEVVYIQLFDNDLDDIDKFEIFLEEKDGIRIPKKPLLAKIFSTPLYNFVKESTTIRLIKRSLKFAKGGTEPILYYKENRVPDVKLLNHQESLQKYGRLTPLSESIQTKYNGQFEFYASAETQIWKDRLEKEIYYLDLIFDLLTENNIKMGIIYIPAKEFFAKGGILGDIKSHEIKAYEQKNPHLKNIQSFCEMKFIDCLMTSRLLWNVNPENLYFPYDAHWNGEGHKVFGKIFVQHLQKSPLFNSN